MARRFVTYNTEDADKLGIDQRGVMQPGAGGSGLPSGGTPYQYLVTDGEGKTGWADRLAWKEEELVTLVDDVELDFTNSPQLQNPFSIVLEEGVDYTVTLNGSDRYECVAYSGTMEGVSFVGLGNGSIGGVAGGNNEPFFILYASAMEMVVVGYDSTALDSPIITFNVVKNGENITPIAEELLPETVALLRAELSEVFAEETIDNFDESKNTPEIYDGSSSTALTLVVGEKYRVNFDGDAYELTANDYFGHAMLGNASLVAGMLVGSTPFAIMSYSDRTYVAALSADPHTISIHKIDYRIPAEYLPEDVPVVPVTESDNGKFLRVVDGAWAAVAIPYAEEASF